MITVKLDKIADSLGKSITDIARDTGLNRNTVTALYHGKVDGIRFSTIETLCNTYNLQLQDVIEMRQEATDYSDQLYKQEVEGVPFFTWPWFNAITDPTMGLVQDAPGKAYMYYKDLSVHVYWYQEQIEQFAAVVYKSYNSRVPFESLFSEFMLHASRIEQLYNTISAEVVYAYSKTELAEFAAQVRASYEHMWKYSAFIDMFDSGFDEQEIARIAEEHHLDMSEVGALLAPVELSFIEERRLRLLELVADHVTAWKQLPVADVEKECERFLTKNEKAIAFKADFAWYRSNYAGPAHITDTEIQAEMIEAVATWDAEDGAATEYEQLRTYTEHQKEIQKGILQKHSIKQNPLWFFERITQWRRHERKRAALMGVHVLDHILTAIERWTGIDHKYLGYLSFDEIDHVLHGLVTKQVLKTRYDKGVLVALEGDEYTVLHEDDAARMVAQFDRMILGDVQGAHILHGQTVYPGTVRGIARVMLHQKDFDSFKEGEILVTAMTRPEFYPIMKRAAGIVTTEGGVSCHAIHARDLHIPCVIGVQRAIQVITDGQEIEVNASTGEITIVS